jgi:GT2 family glycosyltransferase
MSVTVAIPVLNGGALLADVLEAVRGQELDREVELLVCDSGSTDGSVALARRAGARVLEIPRGTFSHGGTRNFLMREARGEHVAFLTQDAVPASPGWLAALLSGFALTDDVALAFGPYRARPDAPLRVRRELDAWFRSFAPDGRPRIDRLDATQRAARDPLALLGAPGFFTDANGCVSRAAWERVPFREIPYAEDHALALDLLFAGYAKAYVPEAAVVHSHDYAPPDELRRAFDEWRALREVYGYVVPARASALRASVVGPTRADGRALRAQGAGGAQLAAGTADSALHHGLRFAGALLGTRADRLAPPVRRALSLERRAGFHPSSDTRMPMDPKTSLEAGGPPERDAGETTPDAAVAAMPRGRLQDLWRRAVLTYRYLGFWTLVWRIVSFPLRFTPLRGRLNLGSRIENEQSRAAAWYREHGRPVTIVIPHYGDPTVTIAAIESIWRTCDREKVHVIVSDDATPDPEHRARLRAVPGIQLVESEENRGFAANANRGLRAADPAHDVVLLNADVEACEHWLEALQFGAYAGEDIGVVGAKLLYPDGRIQHAGVHRNLGAPEWFDHRFRFKPAGHGPANVISPVLAVTGACMYVKREVLDEVGLLDERYPMAYEDVDWCLRAWQAGHRVIYFPAATLVHHESVLRGTTLGERERTSQERFWERWGDFFDARDVRTEDGRLRVVYVTEDTGVGGGHRDIFEHLNRLAERGHDVRLFTLGGQPDWFDLRAPVVTFPDYEALAAALAQEDAIKVATWWNTAAAVWRGSVLRGIPVFFVQDIETSYYPDDETMRHHVLASYRHEFRFMTISGWNRDRLRELGLDAELIPPGIDLDTFRPLPGASRREDVLLALGRSNPLKNLPLTLDAWRALPEPRPELVMFGIEPELGPRHGATYVERPSDEGVNELFNTCTVFVQTSRHEGFCLPPLEAMATGAAVVCTDAHGNRDFCRDGENCLVPEADVGAVRTAIERLLADPALRARLGEEGRRTAADYAWSRRIDDLEAFLERVAAAGPAAGGRVPGLAYRTS